MFSSLTEHLELTFKVSTSNSSPSPLRKGVGLGVNAVRQIQEKQLYISSYSFYFALQSLPEISGDIHSYSLRPYYNDFNRPGNKNCSGFYFRQQQKLK